MPIPIFIAYSHQDSHLVTPIVKLLRATNDLVFLDADSITPGKKWRKQIHDGLETAKLLVVFWCTHSEKSDEVKNEYEWAITQGKDLLPVLLDSCPVPEDLAEFQWIDFRELVEGKHFKDDTRSRGFCSSEPPPSSSVKAIPYGIPFLLVFLSILIGVGLGNISLADLSWPLLLGGWVLIILLFLLIWDKDRVKRYLKKMIKLTYARRGFEPISIEDEVDDEEEVKEERVYYNNDVELMAAKLHEEILTRMDRNTK